MIITKLQGGLGNQLFQWAYGRSLSIEHNTELYIDTSYYDDQGKNTQRQPELYKFDQIKLPHTLDNSKPLIKINDNFIYSKINYNKNYSYYLNGYWQSEKYFALNKDIIFIELQVSKEKYQQLLSIISDNSISLHVRRTDYLLSNGYHPVQDKIYYDKALNIIGKYNELLIFSDDIPWCKNNLNYKNMKFIENQNNIDDLWLMSLCTHNIIANSSFSWWGAWLNRNPNKKVITPINWFGDKSINTQDLIPEQWIRI